MNEKVIQKLRFISKILLLVLLIVVVYFVYTLINKKEVHIYFDSINSFEITSSYYVTVGSNNDNDNYYEKAKLSKYDKKKNKLFEKLYNVGYNSAFFGVNIDKEDEMIAVGSYEKTEDDHEDSIRRALIVKYDKDGKVIFEKDYSLLDNSKFTNVKVVEDGYIVVGQSVYKSTKIGNKDGGAIIVKYSKEGKLLWSKVFGNNKFSIFNDLLIKDNYIYTVGVSDSNVGILSKYDMDGNLIKSVNYSYTDSLGFGSIISKDNNIYVTGSKREKDKTSALIVKYDLDCEYISEVVYDEDGNSHYNKMIIDDDNLVVIGTVINKSDNNYDGIIGKYNYDLKKVSVITYGDERDDYFTDIKYIDKDNDYLVVGYSSYEDGSYLSKFIHFSDALKVLEVN